MRDCFDHYMRVETYDHIRTDLLFNIYGFSASVWQDTVGGDSKQPAVPDEKRDGSVGKTAGVVIPAQAAGATEYQYLDLPGGRISLLLRYAAQISGVHPGEMDRRKSSGNDGDLWSIAWEQWKIPDSFIGDNDKRSCGISVPEHAAG